MDKKRYKVFWDEVVTLSVIVEAEDSSSAIEIVREGSYDFETLNPDGIVEEFREDAENWETEEILPSF